MSEAQDAQSDDRVFLALDVGTSGVKVVLASGKGALLASSYRAYPLVMHADGSVEQDLDEIFEALVVAAVELLAGHPEQVVAGVAVTAQMFNIVAVDEAGVPLAPMISWLDQRCEGQSEALQERLPPRLQFERFGSVLTAKDIVPKILWLAQNRPELYDRARWLLDCKEAIVMRLTGNAVTDHAGASAFRLYDPRARAWDIEACRLVGVDPDKLPPIARATDVAGTLSPEVTRLIGLPSGIPVYVGAGDVPASQLGSGAVRRGEAHLSLGTAAYFGLLLDEPLGDPNGRLGVLAHANPDQSILWLETATGGAALAWVLRLVGIDTAGVVDYERVEQLVDDAEDGMGGLICGPWLSGERVPVFDDSVRAAFSGLALHHGPGHLIRAVMEGVAFQMRWALEYGVDYGQEVSKVRVVGGGILGRGWSHIIADILGHPLELIADPQEAAAVGAAACAIVGSGAQPGFDFLADSVTVERTCQPDPSTASTYAQRYERFTGLYHQLRPRQAPVT